MSTFSEPVLPASILSAVVAVRGADWPAARLTAPDGRTVPPPGPVVESEPPPHAKSVIAVAESAAPVTQREIICFPSSSCLRQTAPNLHVHSPTKLVPLPRGNSVLQLRD